MPRKLPPVIDFDLYGHCVRCHKNMIVEQYIDGRMQRRHVPQYRETQYILDSGSKMRVAICAKCQDNLTDSEEERKEIMDCVVKGWEIETDDLVSDETKPRWTKELKDKHMAKQKNLKIHIRTDKLSEGDINLEVERVRNGNKAKTK